MVHPYSSSQTRKLEEWRRPENAGGVFLSYASQDSDAARRISDALRAAGIEDWLDEHELRGGDAWDQRIRRQVRECVLFMPVISSQTQSRKEGYVRLEWRLAVERMQCMSDRAAFPGAGRHRHSTTSPASVSSKATADPGAIPSRSRTFFGIVTWPLDVTLVAIEVIPPLPAVLP
jgi:hypothetical protein